MSREYKILICIAMFIGGFYLGETHLQLLQTANALKVCSGLGLFLVFVGFV